MNAFNPEIHHRHSIRLKNYDYSQPGVYFVTTCTQNRACLFGEIVGADLRVRPQNPKGQSQGIAPTTNTTHPGDGASRLVLNDAGRMVTTIWQQIPDFYPGTDVDSFVVMPNHFHGIIIIWDGQPRVSPISLPEIVQRFKTFTTKRYTDGVHQCNWQPFYGRLWQRNYYDHIVRDESEFDLIREYIHANPDQWITDRENPVNR